MKVREPLTSSSLSLLGCSDLQLRSQALIRKVFPKRVSRAGKAREPRNQHQGSARGSRRGLQRETREGPGKDRGETEGHAAGETGRTRREHAKVVRRDLGGIREGTRGRNTAQTHR